MDAGKVAPVRALLLAVAWVGVCAVSAAAGSSPTSDSRVTRVASPHYRRDRHWSASGAAIRAPQRRAGRDAWAELSDRPSPSPSAAAAARTTAWRRNCGVKHAPVTRTPRSSHVTRSQMSPSHTPRKSQIDMERPDTAKANRARASSRTVVNLDDLPSYLADALRSMDGNNDGKVTVGDLGRTQDKSRRTASKYATYRKLLIFLFGLFLAQMASTFAVMYGVINYTRETSVSNGVMTTATGEKVVQTGSYYSTQKLSSALPDDAFAQMATFSVVSPSGSSVSLTVQGWARIIGSGQFSSVVQIITSAGTVTLDGRVIAFAATMAPVFSEAGFNVDQSSRRRLLDVATDLIGFFNYLATFDLDALEAAATGIVTGVGSQAHPGFPSSYTMTATVYSVCAANDATWCSDPARGGALTVTNPDFAGVHFFAAVADVAVAGARSLETATFSYQPGRVDTTAIDAGVGVSGSQMAAGGAWANCAATDPSNAPRGILATLADLAVSPVFVDATSSVLGVAARHFTFTSSSFTAHYFDAVATQLPLRVVLAFFDPSIAPIIFDITNFVASPYPALTAAALAWTGPADVTTCGEADVVAIPTALYPSTLAAGIASGDAGRRLLATGYGGYCAISSSAYNHGCQAQLTCSWTTSSCQYANGRRSLLQAAASGAVAAPALAAFTAAPVVVNPSLSDWQGLSGAWAINASATGCPEHLPGWAGCTTVGGVSFWQNTKTHLTAYFAPSDFGNVDPALCPVSVLPSQVALTPIWTVGADPVDGTPFAGYIVAANTTIKKGASRCVLSTAYGYVWHPSPTAPYARWLAGTTSYASFSGSYVPVATNPLFNELYFDAQLGVAPPVNCLSPNGKKVVPCLSDPTQF